MSTTEDSAENFASAFKTLAGGNLEVFIQDSQLSLIRDRFRSLKIDLIELSQGKIIPTIAFAEFLRDEIVYVDPETKQVDTGFNQKIYALAKQAYDSNSKASTPLTEMNFDHDAINALHVARNKAGLEKPALFTFPIAEAQATPTDERIELFRKLFLRITNEDCEDFIHRNKFDLISLPGDFADQLRELEQGTRVPSLAFATFLKEDITYRRHGLVDEDFNNIIHLRALAALNAGRQLGIDELGFNDDMLKALRRAKNQPRQNPRPPASTPGDPAAPADNAKAQPASAPARPRGTAAPVRPDIRHIGGVRNDIVAAYRAQRNLMIMNVSDFFAGLRNDYHPQEENSLAIPVNRVEDEPEEENSLVILINRVWDALEDAGNPLHNAADIVDALWLHQINKPAVPEYVPRLAADKPALAGAGGDDAELTTPPAGAPQSPLPAAEPFAPEGEYPYPSMEEMREKLRSFLDGNPPELRRNQRQALHAVVNLLDARIGSEFTAINELTKKEREEGKHETEPHEKKGNFFEVVSATGTGKTRIFGSMAKAMGAQTLILTPRLLLNQQTKRSFCDENNVAEKDVVLFDNKQPPEELSRLYDQDPPPRYLIATYQSLDKLLQLPLTTPGDKHYRPLVILDEVHKATYVDLIRQKLIGKVLVGGFTATDVQAAKTLFGRQAPVYNLPLNAAIERDLLCQKVETGVINVAVQDQAMLERMRTIKLGSDYNQTDIETFARNDMAIKGAVDFHLNTRHEEVGDLYKLPTIFYTEGVAAAEKGMEIFNDMARTKGVEACAAFVSGNKCSYTEYYMDRAGQRKERVISTGSRRTDGTVLDNGDVRDLILEKFNQGEIQAIFNDSVLELGFDDPYASVCYSLKPTRKPHTVEQQLGRITRRCNDYHQRYGYEEGGNHYGQEKIALAFNVIPEGTSPCLFGTVLGDEPVLTSETYRSKHGQSYYSKKPQILLDTRGITVDWDYAAVKDRLAASRRFGTRRSLLDHLEDAGLTVEDKIGMILAKFTELDTEENRAWMYEKLTAGCRPETFSVLDNPEFLTMFSNKQSAVLQALTDKYDIKNSDISHTLGVTSQTAANIVSGSAQSMSNEFRMAFIALFKKKALEFPEAEEMLFNSVWNPPPPRQSNDDIYIHDSSYMAMLLNGLKLPGTEAKTQFILSRIPDLDNDAGRAWLNQQTEFAPDAFDVLTNKGFREALAANVRPGWIINALMMKYDISQYDVRGPLRISPTTRPSWSDLMSGSSIFKEPSRSSQRMLAAKGLGSKRDAAMEFFRSRGCTLDEVKLLNEAITAGLELEAIEEASRRGRGRW